MGLFTPSRPWPWWISIRQDVRHLSCSNPGGQSFVPASVSQCSFWSHRILLDRANGKTDDEKKNEKRGMGGREALSWGLARIIHERFCCNRGFAAATRLRLAGSPFAPSTYCSSMPRALTAPRARLATRLRDVVPRLCSGP